MKKVCSNSVIWIFVLMLIASGSVLTAEDPPPVQDQANQGTQPIAAAPVPPALRQALASSLGKATSIGAKSIPTPPTGSWGIVSEGSGGGGIFRDSDSEAEAWLGTGGDGVVGYGSASGGFFKDSDGTGYGAVGSGDRGIEAFGTTMGGYFKDLDSSGYAFVGNADYGIRGYGTYSGAYFKDSDSTGDAMVGYGNRGIDARGTEMGGYFKDSDGTGNAYVGYADYGIRAFGDTMGGYFKDASASGYAYAGYGDYGIRGYGNSAGGYFNDLNGSGYAYVGYGDNGIQAFGDTYGGYFLDDDQSGYALVGSGDNGIQAYGNSMGGYFADLNSSGWADVGYSTYKIAGSGTVSFVQNHPYDPSSVIVYAAPEGDEVATYTRGTARLSGGEATVPLGETFKWVTNPDIGLTVHLTPVGDPCVLYVVEKATNEITVRSRDGSDCAFDYLVYGLRIGFEELSIVQEKEEESYIPSMADHRQLYERRPDLKTYNSLERFKGMHHAIEPKAKIDLRRAQALRDAIIEFDPAVHEVPKPPGHEERPVDDLALAEAQRGEVQRVRAARGDHDGQSAPDHSDLSAAIPMDDEGNIYAPSFRPPSREVATLVDVSESVEPGDVLVIDRDTAGLMRRGFEGHDSGVVGVVLDSQSPALSGEEVEAETALHAEVAMAGVVKCKVDATYGAIWPGNLLVTSPTSGHAMRTESPLPGTIVGKALEPLEEGVGVIKVLVMLR